jgi:nicotinate-nucleotide adenylyltransferase
VEVLDLEGRRSPSYTIDTVLELQGRFPQHAFRLLLGTDNLADLPRWKDSVRLLTLAPPLVLGREGRGQAGASVPVVLPALSSSEIRARLGTGDLGALDLLPAKVAEYVRQRGLYGPGTSPRQEEP